MDFISACKQAIIAGERRPLGDQELMNEVSRFITFLAQYSVDEADKVYKQTLIEKIKKGDVIIHWNPQLSFWQIESKDPAN